MGHRTFLTIRRGLALAAAAMTVACGGGGGAGGGIAPPPPPNTIPGGVTTAGMTARADASGSPVKPYINDTDLPKTYTFQVLSSPGNGIATVVNNRLVYTPDVAFTNGLDSFTYRATDNSNQVVDGTARVRVYANSPSGSNGGLGRCTTASTVNPDGTLARRLNTTSCAFYGETVSRVTSTGIPVTVKYVTHRPSNGVLPKAVVVLVAGGTLNAGLAGDPASGDLTATGGNFLVRSAQLYAEAGYLAVVPDRPTDRADFGPEVDAYRVSVDHAVDILAVLRQVNTDNLPLILAGTSRGALSVIANNLIASAIEISSPATAGTAAIPNMQPTFVQRPARVLWHQGDLCGGSTPTDSQNLFNALDAHLTGIGVAASSLSVTGGVQVTMASGTVTPDVCGPYDYHGYMGIEPTVVAAETAYLDGFISSLPANTIPKATYTTVQTAAGVAKQVDLALLASDADSDVLSYVLAHDVTSLGGSVALAGATVTYTPPAATSNKKDYFVYVVTDTKGGVRAAVVTVEIGS